MFSVIFSIILTVYTKTGSVIKRSSEYKGSKQIKVGCLVSNHIEMQPSNYQEIRDDTNRDNKAH